MMLNTREKLENLEKSIFPERYIEDGAVLKVKRTEVKKLSWKLIFSKVKIKENIIKKIT